MTSQVMIQKKKTSLNIDYADFMRRIRKSEMIS